VNRLVPAGIVRALLPLSILIAAAPAAAGPLSGSVRFQGPAPERPTIYMTADPACDKASPKGRPSDALVVDPSGGIANVLVYVKSGLDKQKAAWPAPTDTPKIDQRGCVYVPHVIGVRVGQEIEIASADPTLHNVNARTSENSPFNVALPGADQKIHRSFNKPEVAVKLKCDIHPWMSAYVGVFDHPFFAVTSADGRYVLPTLPEGEYVIEAWHESLGTRSVKIEVDDKEPASLDFSFAGN
jgi:plastocyanin